MLVFVMKQGWNKVELHKWYRINPQTTEFFASRLPLKKWKNEAQKKLKSFHATSNTSLCASLLYSASFSKQGQKKKGTELWLRYLTLRHQ